MVNNISLCIEIEVCYHIFKNYYLLLFLMHLKTQNSVRNQNININCIFYIYCIYDIIITIRDFQRSSKSSWLNTFFCHFSSFLSNKFICKNWSVNHQPHYFSMIFCIIFNLKTVGRPYVYHVKLMIFFFQKLPMIHLNFFVYIIFMYISRHNLKSIYEQICFNH